MFNTGDSVKIKRFDHGNDNDDFNSLAGCEGYVRYQISPKTYAVKLKGSGMHISGIPLENLESTAAQPEPPQSRHPLAPALNRAPLPPVA
jgi:hypothetical protein